jgi:HD-like signal output (HDOD) protein
VHRRTPRTLSPLEAPLAHALEQRLAEGRFDVPVLPEAANAILIETSRTDWSAPKVIACLKRDPTLAAHLLRVANSPAFRGAAEVMSLQQAVARLGGSHLRQLAVVIACEGRLFQVPGFVDEVRAVFRHSLACALFGREIARARRGTRLPRWPAGLLHDVGWPVLLQTVLDLGQALKVVVPHDEALDAADRAHAHVAHHVAAAWKLPVRVREAIERHHAGLVADDELAATVTLADLLARQAAGAPPDELPQQQAPALSALNLYPDALEALVARGDAVWAEAGAL